MGKRNRHHAAGLLLKLPDGVSKTGIGLIDQQMWCWGCDVRRTEGETVGKLRSADTTYPSRPFTAPGFGCHAAITDETKILTPADHSQRTGAPDSPGARRYSRQGAMI